MFYQLNQITAKFSQNTKFFIWYVICKRDGVKERKNKMTLVPIIYTSLLIFSAILLFVIIVSYISFKAKGGNNKPFNSQKHTRINQVQMKPAYVNIPSTSGIGYASAAVVHQRTSKIQATPIYNNRPVQSAAALHNERNVSNNFVQRERERNNNQNVKKFTREERISIVNTPSNYSQPVLQSKVQTRTNTHKLPDLNLLNYYSDKNGTDFITLSA